MSFADSDSTPNQGLSATSQAPRELRDSQKILEIRDASRICQKPPVEGKVTGVAKQLTIWDSSQSPEARLFPQKRQILSIPGVCPKERHRYRVVLGGRVLGSKLTIEQAIALANQSTHH